MIPYRGRILHGHAPGRDGLQQPVESIQTYLFRRQTRRAPGNLDHRASLRETLRQAAGAKAPAWVLAEVVATCGHASPSIVRTRGHGQLPRPRLSMSVRSMVATTRSALRSRIGGGSPNHAAGLCAPPDTVIGQRLILVGGEGSLTLGLQLQGDREVTVVGMQSGSPAFSVETTQLPVTGQAPPPNHCNDVASGRLCRRQGFRAVPGEPAAAGCSADRRRWQNPRHRCGPYIGVRLPDPPHRAQLPVVVTPRQAHPRGGGRRGRLM